MRGLIDIPSWFTCEVAGTVRVGDHEMVLGHVSAATEGAVDATPLVFYRSNVGVLDSRHIRLTRPFDFHWSEVGPPYPSLRS